MNNVKTIKSKNIDSHPHKCKICGLGDREGEYSICEFCGWEDDTLQNEQPDYMGGANNMSFNEYKIFWEINKNEILKSDNPCFKAIDLAKKYYNEKNHK